ncbi:hypothetical protein N7499_001240 [Penicillium canescens]|uniref:Fungal N-terminal domain-containing protein n=1 Tax=Penicillium canescens TaxID=5083 RepID=A0AAD6I2U9_PENCN|nr:uncharacterized protein N7446_003621 [Penicillium canescens]KAJ6027782.1 hypothetical protein N7460_012599 [Penicillium canescens]KAJ6041062.1 hypothetical protein N7444_009967 [Penicillium canescens]KAJ6066584.1 hypothetical protein N7446_003621 [Penicillium canescens]KAJ6101610.1 hypothetical protein N7499_001240 [Penicillium canescens]KAJ6174070.1 hypothetical protein N7485_006882 [Penicillium canescens]
MSGIEVLGVIASAIQVAELGMKLSVRLCTFYRDIKAANQTIQNLSSDVSLTCAILHELGETLQTDEQSKVCSDQAFRTVEKVLAECKDVFQQIEIIAEKETSKIGSNRLSQKLSVAMMRPDLEMFQTHLERLKSTMLLMLNVIMYAGQIRRRAENSVLEDQRKLIQTLIDDKKNNETRYNSLIRLIRTSVSVKSTPEASHSSDMIQSTSTGALSFTAANIAVRANEKITTSRAMHTEGTRNQSTIEEQDTLKHVGDFQVYGAFVRRVLEDIDRCQPLLDPPRYLRFRNGIVKMHMEEYPKYRQTHSIGIIDSSKFFSDPIFDFRGGSPSSLVQGDPRAMQRDETSTSDLTTNPWGYSRSHHDDSDDNDDDYTFDSVADAALPMRSDSFAARDPLTFPPEIIPLGYSTDSLERISVDCAVESKFQSNPLVHNERNSHRSDSNVTGTSVEDGSYTRPVRSHRRRLLGLLKSGNQGPVSIQSEPLDKTLDRLVLKWTTLTVDEIQR